MITMEERIKTAKEKAAFAFWAVVAEQFPEAKSGDMSPLEVNGIETAMGTAIDQWIKNNVGG